MPYGESGDSNETRVRTDLDDAVWDVHLAAEGGKPDNGLENRH